MRMFEEKFERKKRGLLILGTFSSPKKLEEEEKEEFKVERRWLPPSRSFRAPAPLMFTGALPSNTTWRQSTRLSRFSFVKFSTFYFSRTIIIEQFELILEDESDYLN